MVVFMPWAADLLQKLPSRLTEQWRQVFQTIQTILGNVPQWQAEVNLATQGAAVVQTPTGRTLAAGLYRVNVQLRITTPAAVSSAIEPTIYWTDGGVACSFSLPALTGNTTHSQESAVILVNVDAQTTIDYSVAYASNPAGIARYALDIVVEALP